MVRLVNPHHTLCRHAPESVAGMRRNTQTHSILGGELIDNRDEFARSCFGVQQLSPRT
jgi:hypothetical protein